MKRMLARGVLALAFATVALTSALAEKRVALVIGNSDYRHTAALPNPRNDAADIAAVLRRLQFTVIEGQDLDKRGMEHRIREFALALKGADVGLFFYAGHGLQVDGQNYLAPVDAALTSEPDLDFEAVQLNLVLRQLERHARLSLVFLDACRDNPLATTLARSLKARSRSTSVGRGLARVEKAVGMMIAFATQPGNVALDGDGRNSPFTTALLKNIESRRESIGDMMIQVRNDVVTATDGRQVPWENSSLTGKFYFKPGAGGGGKTTAGATSDGLDVPDTRFDYTFWTSIRDSNDPALYNDYLTRFPDGVFASIARAKRDGLRGIEVEPKQPKPAAKPPAHGGKQASLRPGDAAATTGTARRETSIDPEAARLRLARDTQTALKRLGCYSGKIDGVWGRGSRAAIARLNRVARLSLAPEPSAANLDVIKSTYFYKGRRCAAVTKKRTEPRKRPATVKRQRSLKQAKRTAPSRTKARKTRKSKVETPRPPRAKTKTSRKTPRARRGEVRRRSAAQRRSGRRAGRAAVGTSPVMPSPSQMMMMRMRMRMQMR